MNPNTILLSIPLEQGDVQQLKKVEIDLGDEAEVPLWLSLVGDKHAIKEIIRELLPPIRSLDLAGYQTTHIGLGLRRAGQGGSDGWIRINIDETSISLTSVVPQQNDVLQVRDEEAVAVSFDWPEHSQTAFVLYAIPRVSLAGRPFAIPASSSLLPLPEDWQDEGGYWTLISSVEVDGLEKMGTALFNALSTFDLDGMIEGLAERWQIGTENIEDSLNPYTFETPPGLLWIFDPAYWDSDPPEWNDERGLKCLDVGVKLKLLIDAFPKEFLDTQIKKYSSWKARRWRTVDSLLGRLPSSMSFAAKNLSNEFYDALLSRHEELGFPLPKHMFENVIGPAIIGLPTSSSYLYMLSQMAIARLFPFPALAIPGLPTIAAWEGEPIDVNLTTNDEGEPYGVEIRILGSDPLSVTQVYDLGYSFRESFSWEYKGPDAVGLIRLVIVAAPGVAIFGQENVPTYCKLAIYRVQDHDLVPSWGEYIPEHNYTIPYDEGSYYASDLHLFSEDADVAENEPSNDPQPAFHIKPLPDGCLITYPAAASLDEIKYYVEIKVGEGSPRDRFSFYIEPYSTTGHNLSDIQRYYFKVLFTGDVQINVRYSDFSNNALVDLFWRVDLKEGISRIEADTLALLSVPPIGYSLDEAFLLSIARTTQSIDYPYFSRKPFYHEELMFIVDTVVFLGKLGVDIGIGVIPIVGDAVDILEFANAYLTGKDKWGEPVTGWDWAFMVAGLLPFVSSGALKAMRRVAN